MAEGMCPKCKEWTTVEESCCGYGAEVDGEIERPEDEKPVFKDKIWERFRIAQKSLTELINSTKGKKDV